MRSTRSLHGDERAIEGLPIRLVIALVVGVASLAVMMQILGGIGPVGAQEVTLEHEGDAVQSMPSSGSTIDINLGTVTVTTKSGDPVEGAQILIVSDTLTLEEPVASGSGSSGVTDSNGEVSLTSMSVEPNWRPDQQRGKVKLEIEAPSSGNFEDNEANGEIIISR